MRASTEGASAPKLDRDEQQYGLRLTVVSAAPDVARADSRCRAAWQVLSYRQSVRIVERLQGALTDRRLISTDILPIQDPSGILLSVALSGQDFWQIETALNTALVVEHAVAVIAPLPYLADTDIGVEHIAVDDGFVGRLAASVGRCLCAEDSGGGLHPTSVLPGKRGNARPRYRYSLRSGARRYRLRFCPDRYYWVII